MTNHTIHPAHAFGKRCPACNTFKSASEFGSSGCKYGYLKSWCRRCSSARSLERYHANPQKHRLSTIKWIERNPDRAAAAKRYRKANHEKILARGREQDRIRAKTPERREQKRNLNAKYRERHREQIRNKSAAYYVANRESVNERIKLSVAKNPDLYFQLHKAAKHRRKVRLANSGPSEKFTDREIFERDQWTCGLCGTPVAAHLRYPDSMSASLDHVLPIAKGGGHTRSNVQCAHLRCNLSKRDRERAQLQGAF